MKTRIIILVALFGALVLVAPVNLFAERGDAHQSRTIRMFGGGYVIQDQGENLLSASWSHLRFVGNTDAYIGMGTAFGVNEHVASPIIETSLTVGWRFSTPQFPVAAAVGARFGTIAFFGSDAPYAFGVGPTLVIEAPAHAPLGVAIAIEPTLVTDFSSQPQWMIGIKALGVIRSRVERRVLRWE